MKKLYEKNELTFALVWIVIYCVLQSLANPLNEMIGIEYSASAAFCILQAVVLFAFIRKNNLLKRYGLCKPLVPACRFLYYVPLVVLASGNLWNGVAFNYTPVETVCRIICMLCVGFLEEVIFRGLLFESIAKDTETGKSILAEQTQYKVKSLDLNRYVSDGMKKKDGEVYETDRDGRIVIPVKLQQGTYQLEEIKAPKGYVVAKEPQQFKVDGKTASITLEQKDMPQKGKITIKKIGEYKHNDNWADIREKVMGGIDFDIIALTDIITPDGTVRAEKGQVVDTVRTDFNGNVSSKPLYLGPYNVVEKDAPVEYRIAEPINVALVYGDQNVDIVEKQINILNRLKRNIDSLGETPKTGDESGVNTILLVMLLSLTVMAVTAVLFRLRKDEQK